MLGRQSSAQLRRFALSLFLLSASIASAQVVDGVPEAGFSRVKVSFRARLWRDDPAAIPALSSARHVEARARGKAQMAAAAGVFEVDGD